MKSYTDIEQSNKLAVILPLESADMCWFEGEPFVEAVTGYEEERAESHCQAGMEMYPCWSLAALLNILNFPSLTQNKEDEWEVCVPNCESDEYIEVSAVNPIDACYEMILKLNELNLL